LDGQFNSEKFPDKIRRIIVLGWREQTRVHILHHRIGYQPYDGRWTVSSEMANRALFKWLKQHLKIKSSGVTPKTPSHPDIRRHHNLLLVGLCTEENGRRQVNLRDAADCKYLTYWHNTLRDLFGKPNCNIVNELEGSTDQLCFNC
jgi:hypothetical protein